MKNTNYEWVERKVSTIFSYIGIIIFLLGFLAMIFITIISLFTNTDPMIGFVCFMASLPTAFPFILIGIVTSTKNKYTSSFIKTMETKIAACKTKEDLLEAKDYFFSQAVEGTQLRLSYPLTLKGILNKIKAQIEILEKIEK